jgi:hypothetical protein
MGEGETTPITGLLQQASGSRKLITQAKSRNTVPRIQLTECKIHLATLTVLRDIIAHTILSITLPVSDIEEKSLHTTQTLRSINILSLFFAPIINNPFQNAPLINEIELG